MVEKDLNRLWKWSMPLICLSVILIWFGVSPLPVAAQEAVIYPATQKLGQATSATLENAGTKVPGAHEAAAAQSPGSNDNYSGSAGKIIESPGQAVSQGKLLRDRVPRRHYYFEFWADGLPKGSDPSEAYWFKTKDGKLMLVDPLITQRFSRMPR